MEMDNLRFHIQNLNLGKMVLQVKSRWIYLKTCIQATLKALKGI